VNKEFGNVTVVATAKQFKNSNIETNPTSMIGQKVGTEL
jgi:hypothetical protein